jgi:hypothetical protein
MPNLLPCQLKCSRAESLFQETTVTAITVALCCHVDLIHFYFHMPNECCLLNYLFMADTIHFYFE